MKTVDIGGLYVNTNLSNVTNALLWWEMSVMWERVHVWGRGNMENLYIPPNFAVNLKLLRRDNVLKKTTTENNSQLANMSFGM